MQRMWRLRRTAEGWRSPAVRSCTSRTPPRGWRFSRSSDMSIPFWGWRTVLTAGGSLPPAGIGPCAVWDATNGSEIFCLRGHTASISAVAFSPDGQRLASISRSSAGGGRPVSGQAVIWDLRKGQIVLTLPERTDRGSDPGLADVTFSPDGERLATVAGRTVRVWKAATGQEVLVLPSVEDLVMRMAYSPDGKRLAAASRDGSVKVWDAVTGETCLTLGGHTSAVQWG